MYDVMRCARAVAATVVLLGSASGGLAQDHEAEQILKAARASYIARGQQLNPVRIRYELDVLTTKAWLVATKAKSSTPGDLRHTDAAEFARKGSKYKFTVAKGDTRVPPELRQQFIVSDGEATFRSANQTDRILMTRKRDELRLVELPLVTVGEVALLEILAEWNEGRVSLGALSARTSAGPNGDRVIQVDFKIQPQAGCQCRCWLLPDKGYVVKKLEVRNAKGGRMDTYECDAYDDMNGIVFPRSGKHEHFTALNDLGYAMSMRLISFETAASRVPDDLFELEVPEGTSIWDQDNQVHVRYTKRVQSHLDGIIEDIGPRTGLWRAWLWWGLGFFSFVGVAGVVYRRFQRRGAAKASA